jgi:thiamine transport system substrate-binding protein
MKHFLSFIGIVFIGLFALLYWKQTFNLQKDNRKVLKVYANSSFYKQWGPGPWLKEQFEAKCDCRVEYVDVADSVLILQKLKTGVAAADLILGLDQYDIEMAQKSSDWKSISTEKINFRANIKSVLNRTQLVPYDWGVMAFMIRQSEWENKKRPNSLNDLLGPDFKSQISLQDPRTSSAGLQFVFWLISVMGEEKAFKYIEKLQGQVKTWGPSWSMSYGMFQKNQVKTTLSWTTSSVYHQVEENSKDIVSLEFVEGHPLQIEYMGIPTSCRNCELAEQFVQLVLSNEGQKVIMQKNYMFPVIEGVDVGTPFAELPSYKTLDAHYLPTQVDRERILKKWSQLRRGE